MIKTLKKTHWELLYSRKKCIIKVIWMVDLCSFLGHWNMTTVLYVTPLRYSFFLLWSCACHLNTTMTKVCFVFQKRIYNGYIEREGEGSHGSWGVLTRQMSDVMEAYFYFITNLNLLTSSFYQFVYRDCRIQDGGYRPWMSSYKNMIRLTCVNNVDSVVLCIT